jgi:hypothetical protein
MTRLTPKARRNVQEEARAEELRVKRDKEPYRQARKQQASERLKLMMSNGIALRELAKQNDLQFTEISFRLGKIEQLLAKQKEPI